MAPEAKSIPLAYDKEENHDPAHWGWLDRLLEPGSLPGPWINVVFADGHVEGHEADSWESLATKHGWVGKE